MLTEVASGRTGPSTHASGARRFFARAVYIFFGKALLFLFPAVAITGAGVYFAVSQPDEFQSVGVLSVSSETFLGGLSQVRSSEFSYEAPSVTISRQFNELMQTDSFADSVIEGAGLTSARESGAISVDDIREGVFATATGSSLMRIVSISDDRERARLLAVSGIATFTNFVISSEVLGSDVAESFYDQQLTAYKSEVDAASEALEAFLIANPEPLDARLERDIADQLEIARLNDQLTRAQARFDGAFDNRELSRLATVESSADIGQRFRILDEPASPLLPTSGLTGVVTTAILYGVLGLLVSLGAVALASVLDRSIHSAADLERLGVTVRAVVPKSKSIRVEGPRRSVPAAASRDMPMQTVGQVG